MKGYTCGKFKAKGVMELNDNKANYYTQQIMKAFLDNEMVTTNQLVEEVGLSEKTIRLKIDTINTMLKEQRLGQICKKPRIGMWLDADESQRAKILVSTLTSNVDIIQNDHTRMISALKQILKTNQYSQLTTRQLADSLYLSVPTALKVINDCQEWLKLYCIELKIVRNKGFELTYNEGSYRLALKDFVLKLDAIDRLDENILYFMPGLQLESIRKSLIATEKEWGFSLAEDSFNEILIYLCISIYECMRDEAQNLTFSQDEIRMLSQYREYQLAEALFKQVSIDFEIKVPIEDVAFLSIQILCSKMIDQGHSGDAEEILREYDLKLETFVAKMIGVVSAVMNVDLTKDKALYRGLLMHLKPAIFRLKYERMYSNELKGYIKSEFKQTMRVSWIISVLFEEYFGLKITEDELSYIALYIQTALDRNSKPLTAILVSVASMGINQMLCDKICRVCEKIKEIKVVSYHDFRIQEYPNVNLILTTKHLGISDQRIVEISELFSSVTVTKIQDKIQEISTAGKDQVVRFDAVCHQFFEPDLIFTGLKMTSKKSILQFLCTKLVKKGYVTSKYYKTVLDRESQTPTSIGNGVAIPHGEQNEINEAKIVIATLDKPILWDSEWVDVIFLLVVKMTNDFEIKRTQMFYKQYIKLIDSDEKVNTLRNFRSNIDFYQYLIQ